LTLPLTEKRKRDREYYHANKDRLRERRLAQSREWAEKNRERKRELSRIWTEQNPDRRKKQALKWRDREDRREEARDRSAKWRSENRERHIASLRKWTKEKGAAWRAEWKKRNPDRDKAQQHNRRARKRAAGGKITQADVSRILTAQKWKCAYCRQNLRRTGYHLDHIFPLARGGSNAASNHQATCPPCNLSKRDHDPIYFARSLGRLL